MTTHKPKIDKDLITISRQELTLKLKAGIKEAIESMDTPIFAFVKNTINGKANIAIDEIVSQLFNSRADD